MTLKVRIDGVYVEVPQGTTIMQAAKLAGAKVPVLCYSDHSTANGLCRLCVVESEGERGLLAACVSRIKDGAVIQCNSEVVARVRKTILEMLAASVNVEESPELQQMLMDYGADPARFEGAAKRQAEILDDNPMFIRDYTQCVLCWRCVQVCADDAQYTFAINFSDRGFHTSIATFYELPIPATTCVFCGQCVGTCPTGALKGKREFLMEQGIPIDQIFMKTKRGKRT
jgi:NADH dehydrogenase/NADH:ubiquinone oxidoreductase subunit G